MENGNRTAVAIIGAGPYGLSIAAHLRALSVEFRIFGTPMDSWRAHMPKGMFLKSEGCASSIFDPEAGFTLARYCADAGLPYGEYAAPVSLETFAAYGLAFQRRLVPMVEDVLVSSLDRSSDGFELGLANGARVSARAVVVATGIAHAGYIPPVLAALPAALRSHAGDHADLSAFAGRNVSVVGAGQSALETAALLAEAGADVRLIVRGPRILWNSRPDGRPRSLAERMRHPMSSLGPGLGLWFYANAPILFWALPPRIRMDRTRKVLGPAGAWWLRERIEGRLPTMLGQSIEAAEAQGGGVRLQMRGPDGRLRQVTTDHVIAGTGYRFALDALPFLAERLRAQVRALKGTPVLSPSFESSVPALYFTGLASANQFGPAMRFLYGAGFTAGRVSRHIAARERVRVPAWGAGAPKCREFIAAAEPTH